LSSDFGGAPVLPPRLFFHDEGKDVVGSLQDLCARAEILRQQELARLAGGLCAAHGIGGVFLQEDRGVGQTEAVDRLLDVADEEKVLPFPADGLENTLLHGVGVLIFVDQVIDGVESDVVLRALILARRISQTYYNKHTSSCNADNREQKKLSLPSVV